MRVLFRRIQTGWLQCSGGSNLLQCSVQVLLNYWLSRFVVETRREDGQPYPPTSIKFNLLTGLYYECQKYDPNSPTS